MFENQSSCYVSLNYGETNYSDICDYIAVLLGDNFKIDVILFYGSIVTNCRCYDSDIDIIVLQKKCKFPSRIDANFNSIPITIYLISDDDILLDGQYGKYGGYFVGKFVCPYLIFARSQEISNTIDRSVGSYYVMLKSLFDENSASNNTRGSALSDTLNWMKDVIPWHDYYAVKLRNCDESKQIESMMIDNLERCIKLADESSILSGLNKSLEEGPTNFRKLLAARFWGVGTALHGGDLSWPDKYVSGARKKAQLSWDC